MNETEQTGADELKPGNQTTEYKIALILSIGGLIIALLQILAPDQADEVKTVWDRIAELLPILLPLFLGREYIVSRSALKITKLRGG